MLARHECVTARGNMGVLAKDGEDQIQVWLHRRDECLPLESHGQPGARRSRPLPRYVGPQEARVGCRAHCGLLARFGEQQYVIQPGTQYPS